MTHLAHLGLHEFNTGFTWKRPSGRIRRLIGEQGLFVIPDAFDPAAVAEMTAEIDPIESRISAALSRRGASGQSGGFTIAANLVRRSGKL